MLIDFNDYKTILNNFHSTIATTTNHEELIESKPVETTVRIHMPPQVAKAIAAAVLPFNSDRVTTDQLFDMFVSSYFLKAVIEGTDAFFNSREGQVHMGIIEEGVDTISRELQAVTEKNEGGD